MEFKVFDFANFKNYSDAKKILDMLNIYYYKHNKYNQLLLLDDEYNLLLDIDTESKEYDLSDLWYKFDFNQDLKDDELAKLLFSLLD